MDFESRIHSVAQRLIPQRFGGGYPPMLVYYCRFAPVLLSEDGTPKAPLQPDPRLLEAAARLGSAADFLVITSNTPHLFQDQIERAAGRELLSMVDLTLGEVRRRQWTSVDVVGLGDPLVYTGRLAQEKIAFETIDSEARSRLDRAIGRLMEGREDAQSTQAAVDAVESLRARDIDGIILGCTEIPLLLGEHTNALDLISPLQLLAEAAVGHALDEEPGSGMAL